MQRLWKGVEVVNFNIGDEVKVKGVRSSKPQVIEEVDYEYDISGLTFYYLINDEYYEENMLEPIEDPLVTKIEERNNKPQKTEEPWLEEYFEVLEEEAAIRPTHYQNTNGNGKDLFDEWYERYYHSNKRFTGREVFIEIMKSVAERYIRRYPNKNDEDILKGIETLTRLKQMEELQ